MIDNQIKRFIGDKQLAYLTTADLQKFYNKIKKKGRVREHYIHGHELSGTMVRSINALLYYEMFLLELSTGMRRGELLGLKWSDISFINGSLKISR